MIRVAQPLLSYVSVTLHESNELSGCSGSRDGLKQSHGVESLIRWTAQGTIGCKSSDEISVDGLGGRRQGDVVPRCIEPFLLQGLVGDVEAAQFSKVVQSEETSGRNA